MFGYTTKSNSESADHYLYFVPNDDRKLTISSLTRYSVVTSPNIRV